MKFFCTKRDKKITILYMWKRLVKEEDLLMRFMKSLILVGLYIFLLFFYPHANLV